MKLLDFNSLKGETPCDKLRNWMQGEIYVQPKYNGVFAKFIPGLGLYTRQGKRWYNTRLNDAISAVLDQATSAGLCIMGELVGLNDMSFQQLCGAVAVNGVGQFPDSIRLVVFDAWDLRQPAAEQPWSYRMNLLKQFEHHVRVFSALIPFMADELYNWLVANGFEGCVYRCNPALPIFDGRPHPQMVKRKRRHDMEGEIIGVEEGKGKRRGMLGAFVVKLPSGRTVKVGGGRGMTDDMLTAALCQSKKGQMLTFSYEELSDTGVPLKPQFVAIRSHYE